MIHLIHLDRLLRIFMDILSEVRKGKPFRAVSRVRLMLTVKGGNRNGINVNGGDFLNSNRVIFTTERLNMEKDNLKLIDVI